MQERISLRDANHYLSRYIALVEKGREFVITRRGRAVARLMPVREERQLNAEQAAALARTIERLRKGYSLSGERVDRETLHER